VSGPEAGLQFDTAEPVQAAAADVRCAACGAPLDAYFEVRGAVACARCKEAVVAAAARSHLPTLLAATALGLVAAAVGSALYYAVAKITGYEIGLISIVVGLLVGFAVRKGSAARGGWRYQALAIFLTYLSIASTYVPRVFEAMGAEQQQAQPEAPGAAAPADAAPAGPAVQAADAPAAPAAQDEAEPGLLLSFAILLGFTLALPFLSGLENVMGLVIIAIGLYEAWKVNRVPPLTVTGPYAVGAARSADA